MANLLLKPSVLINGEEEEEEMGDISSGESATVELIEDLHHRVRFQLRTINYGEANVI